MPAGRTRKKLLALAAFLPSLPNGICTTHPEPDLWHPDRPNEGQEREAIDLCNICPEENGCLLFAMRAHPIAGIWGGTTAAQRTALFSVKGSSFVMH